MVDKTVIRNSLWNAFPSVESFNNFKEKDREISVHSIPGIIRFTYKNNLITERSEKAFVAFLAENDRAARMAPLPENSTFDDVLDVLCGNLSTNALISQLQVTAKTLLLPEITASMITRLKKNFFINTPKKRALFRILAFKLAEIRPGLNWHYENLLNLQPQSESESPAMKENAGITITFHLQGQGEIIAPADVLWLKNELASCIEYVQSAIHLHNKTIETIGATSFNLKSTKKSGSLEEPRLYNIAVLDMLSIAHQMSVRWLLSAHSSQQKKLMIIIQAGLFPEANNLIPPVLKNNLFNESGIYLTDFAYLCAQIAVAKITFECVSQPIQWGTGYTGNLWSVKDFMTYNYYDYIPCLLDENMLPRSIADPAYVEFRRVLHSSQKAQATSFKAIAAMHRHPQSTCLRIEIAKVLRARQMPYEADAVISSLLLSDPYNTIARVMRMMIYSNIAQAESDITTCKLAFDRAVTEAEFITRSCDQEKTSSCEIGLLYLAIAFKYIKFLRNSPDVGTIPISSEDIFHYFKKAQEYFLKGLTVSPTGKDESSFYWLTYTTALMDLFSLEIGLFSKNSQISLTDNNNVFQKTLIRVFMQLGLLRDMTSVDEAFEHQAMQTAITILNHASQRYKNPLISRSYAPFMKYTLGQFIWDFVPNLNFETCSLILILFNVAMLETKKLIVDDVCVYHIGVNFIPADKFLSQIQDNIDVVRQYVTDEDLKTAKDTSFNPDKLKAMSKIKLLLRDIDR